MKYYYCIFVLFCTAMTLAQPMQKNPNWLNEYSATVQLQKNMVNKEGVTFEENGLDFRRGKGETFTNVWARGRESKGVYPDELLSPLFIRKIIFRELELYKGKVLWIFTGTKAGFTVELSPNRIRLLQRWYDSFGFHDAPADTSIQFARFPQKEFITADISYSGQVFSVALSYSHDLKIRLYLNGKLVATQLCIFDVTRHQLRYTGTEGVMAGTILKPKDGKNVVKVDPDSQFQDIIGFGGITSVVAYNELSEQGKKDWWSFLQDYNLLMQREYPNGTQLKKDCSNFDNLDDASVHYYGDNFPNGEISDFNYNRKIMDLGGMVIFEFWALPPWAAKTADDGTLRTTQKPIINQYTRAMVNYCKESLKKTGRPPHILGIQNEKRQSAEDWQQMTLALRKKLDENGFQDVKIHMHNAPRLAAGIKSARAFTEKSHVWDIIDYCAANLYDYQNYFTDPDGYDKKIKEWTDIVGKKTFLSTEICINNSRYQHDSYHLALTMGQLYHKNFVMMNASSIMYCWMLLNGPQPSFDATRSLFKVSLENDSRPVPSSKQLRVFGAFSRHLPKGMKRVKVVNTNPDLLISAFEKGHDKTMIILNRGSARQQVKIEWPGEKFKGAEITNTYKENVNIPLQKVMNSEGYVHINGGEILTLF